MAFVVSGDACPFTLFKYKWTWAHFRREWKARPAELLESPSRYWKYKSICQNAKCDTMAREAASNTPGSVSFPALDWLGEHGKFHDQQWGLYHPLNRNNMCFCWLHRLNKTKTEISVKIPKAFSVVISDCCQKARNMGSNKKKSKRRTYLAYIWIWSLFSEE